MTAFCGLLLAAITMERTTMTVGTGMVMITKLATMTQGYLCSYICSSGAQLVHSAFECTCKHKKIFIFMHVFSLQVLKGDVGYWLFIFLFIAYMFIVVNRKVWFQHHFTIHCNFFFKLTKLQLIISLSTNIVWTKIVK